MEQRVFFYFVIDNRGHIRKGTATNNTSDVKNKRIFFLNEKKCFEHFKNLTTFNYIIEQHNLKNVNNCLNTNVYSYLETSVGQSSNLYLNVHFFNTSVNKTSVAA